MSLIAIPLDNEVDDLDKICVFFGHRDFNEKYRPALEAEIRAAIQNHGVTTFWCGGYGSFDTCAARTVNSLKLSYPEIRLFLIQAYLPKPGEELLSIYDGSIYPEGLELVPLRYAITHRNRWMVANCDMVIAWVEHSYGGGYQACQYARTHGKHVVNAASKEERNGPDF